MGPQETTIFIAFGWVAALIGVLIIYLIFVFNKQQKKYRQLQKDKLNAEIKAAEEERNNIATELHNDIAPFLASLSHRISTIQTNDQVQIQSCQQGLEKYTQQIRDMANTLSPFSIHNIPFQEALVKYIEEINMRQDLSITLTEIERIVLNTDQNNQCYRMLQEVIQNTIKHAQATELKIEISLEDDMLLIRTADNGIGFNLDLVRAQNKLGLGLLGIYSRIEYLNGTIDSSEELSKGTRYNIRIPLFNSKNN
jgi:signal transduction histidine kinase